PTILVEMIAHGLTQAGMEVHVATTMVGGDSLPTVRDGVTYWCFQRQIGFYKFSCPFTRWLEDNVSLYQIVHIHALFSYVCSTAAYWAKRRGVPYVVRPLGVLNQWGMKNRRPILKQVSFRLIERRILENAALVHFTTEQERAEAALLGVKIRSTVIPNPVKK